MKQTTEEVVRNGGIGTMSEDQIDELLLLSASFEPRSTYVADNLSDGYRARRAFVYVNSEFIEGQAGQRTRKNLYRLVEKASRHADEVSVIEGSWLSPVQQIKAIRDALDDTQSSVTSMRVTVDCTTFNREALLATVLVLRAKHPTSHLRVLYASPQTHGQWLSRGYRAVRNMMGLSGVHFPSRPTVLAVLSGFEPHRTQKLIEEHEPALVLLGVGDPPTSGEFLQRNLAEQKLVLARQKVQEFRFPTSDIHACTKQLGQVLRPHLNESNIVVAPMSTKFSTLAALLVAEELTEIQMSYCLPGEYNVEDYSDGVRALYSETLPQAHK